MGQREITMNEDKLIRVLNSIYQEFEQENMFTQDYTGDVLLRFSKGGVQEAIYRFESLDSDVQYDLIAAGSVHTYIHNNTPNKTICEKKNIVKSPKKLYIDKVV